MGFLNWLLGEKNSLKSDTSLKSNPSLIMEIVQSPHQDVAVEIANNWKFKEIGNTEPVCPYCNYKFEKMLQRKKECPNCKKIILSRTRPLDSKKILLREDQLQELEKQLEIRHILSFIKKYINTLRQRKIFDDTRIELHAQLGIEPTINDVFWGFLNKDSLYHASTKNWGLYRNAIRQQAELLNLEGKLRQALEFYMWVCYLDINGNDNCSPRFNLDLAFLAPENVKQFLKIGKELKLSRDDIKTIFLEYNKKMTESLRPPISPNKAWQKIEKEVLSTLDLDN